MALASCKSDKNVGENPFFAEWNTPYGVPPFDRITPAHFLPALERGMSLHDAEIDAITSNNDAPTFENVILAYDDSGQMLAQTELIFGMLCAAENTAEMQALQEQVMPMLAAHADKILLNEKLFERVKAVYDRRAALELDADQSRLLEKTYRGFVRAGALLDAEQKARLKAINGELSLASVKFGQNILAENNNYTLMLESSDLDGIPANVRDQAREKAEAMGKKGKYAFTLHKPSLIPFLTYSQKRELREEIYKAYLNRCNNGDEYDNKQLINDFIRLRTEKAHLLGYPSYADYVVDEKAIRKGRLHQYMRVEGLGHEVGFADLIKAADEAEAAGVTASIVNVNDERFLSPDSMIEEICAACEESGQPVPETLGELMHCVYESLALCYREAVEGLSQLAGHEYASINIVGGGCRDGHLNRRTAEVCGLPVYAGPVEGTALGNLAVQMLADGVFPHLKAVRAAIAESFDVQKVEP